MFGKVFSFKVKLQFNMGKKLIGIYASVALVLSLAGASVASALTAGDISMLLNAGIINSSQAANLTASLAPASAAVSSTNFAKDLTVGSRGADVTALQNLLGVSPATGYFGALTKAALITFQLSKGITPAAGYFGSITRKIVNGSVTTTTTTTTTTTGVPTGTDLIVSLAPTSPVSSAIIAGQAAADLAEFTFTNRSASPAVVTTVSLARTGVSADTSLDNVYLYNGAVRLTDAATVSSGKINFNAASGIFTVPAGSSMIIAVKADIDAAANGQLISVALTNVNASVPTTNNVYPLSGAPMSVFSSSDIARATSTLQNSVLGSGLTLTAGALNQTIWSTNLNLYKTVYLKSLALKVIGSIPSNSLGNLKLYAAGMQIGSATGIDSNGMITFDLTSQPYKMDSGRVIEVRADIINGSSRTFSVQLQNASDMQLIDSNYNVGIAVVSKDNVTQSGIWTISSGSVVVQQDSTFNAANIVTGSTNIPLSQFTMKAYGEDMKISQLAASSSVALDNVSLFANGVQIGSTKTLAANTNTTYSLGSSLIIPAGQTVTITIQGDIKYNGTNLATTSAPIVVSLVGVSGNGLGSYSSNVITTPGTISGTPIAIAGQTMTVVGAGLVVAVNSAYANSPALSNVSNTRIGSYVLQANSSENLRITNLTINLGGTGIIPAQDLSNLYVSANGIKTTPIAPQAINNNFNVDLTIPRNTTQVVDIYADLGSNTNSDTATTSLVVNGYGVSSNITVTSPIAYGQTITIGAGTITSTSFNSSASPVAQLVVGGSTNPSLIANYNLVSANGASTISEMYFNVAGPITNLTVGGISFPVVGGKVQATGLSITIPVGTAGQNVPVSATYSKVGTGGGVNSMQTASTSLTGYKYTSGNTTLSTTTLSGLNSAAMVVVSSKPTVTLTAGAVSGSSNIIGGQFTGLLEVARVTVSADSNGPITLQQLPLSLTLSNAATTTDGIIVVKINNGGTAQTDVTESGFATTSAGGTDTGVITFTDNSGAGFPISVGSPVEFDIYANVKMAAYDSVNNPTAISTTISGGNFVWADANANYATSSNTSLITNFPSNGVSVSTH